MKLEQRETLFTPSFYFASIGNFLLFLGFYQLMPVLPVYLMDVFDASAVEVGVVLSCYIVAALVVRPFSGFLADRFNRRTFYLIGFGLFTLTFVAYPLVKVLMLFVLLRVVHGITFGMVTTTGITLIVDIMPSSRRGEGLGYYGIANNLSMAIGPMVALMMMDSGQSYDAIFYSALICCFLGFLCVLQIKAPAKPKAASEPLSFDRFFLKKGLFASPALLLMGIPYGITTSYLALYAKELAIGSSTGLFFTMMAVGLILSRTFSGKMIDQGKLVKVVAWGQLVLVLTFALFALIGMLNPQWGSMIAVLFFTVATLMGLGYGMIFPAYNSLFVDLAPNNRRATASSTYLTSWDCGIGLGLVFGGTLSDQFGFPFTYFSVALLVCLSTFWFVWKVGPHYLQNKLR
jgi:MFS family permease